jgi:hypothetical protein
VREIREEGRGEEFVKEGVCGGEGLVRRESR